MRALFWTFLVLSGLIGCQTEEKTINYSEMELTNILLDIHTARIAVINADELERDSLEKVYMNQIADIHSLNMEELNQILASIENGSVDLNDAFNRLQSRIEAMKDSMSMKN